LRDARIDLERIVICAEKVIEYAGALTFEEFITDGLRYDATLRYVAVRAALDALGSRAQSPVVLLSLHRQSKRTMSRRSHISSGQPHSGSEESWFEHRRGNLRSA
jgi:hypothetical protein